MRTGQATGDVHKHGDGVRENRENREDWVMSESNIYKLADWLADMVNFPVPAGLVRAILAERKVAEDMAYVDVNEQVRDLCKADMYSRIALTSPNRLGAISDSDNGWSHSDGGYTLTESDKDRLLAEANEIYDKYDEPTKGKKQTIRITQHGIHRRGRPIC